MSLSILSQHRKVGGFGLEGGEPGKPGSQRVERAGGGVDVLDAIDGVTVHANDRLVLETPGGGGYGKRRS
jgi:5-oxoprolinase (ATP-hydrolysing)